MFNLKLHRLRRPSSQHRSLLSLGQLTLATTLGEGRLSRTRARSHTIVDYSNVVSNSMMFSQHLYGLIACITSEDTRRSR